MLTVFIMTMLRRAIQRELVDFMENLQGGNPTDFTTVSKAAFCKARKKLKPLAFIKLRQIVNREFYDPSNDGVLLWNNCRLIAHDGSTVEVPNSKEVCDKWGVFKVRSDGKKTCMARMEQSFDVLNHLCLAASIDGFRVSEGELYSRNLGQIEPIQEKDLHIFDRYYASYQRIFELSHRGGHFCFRMKKDWWKVVETFHNSDSKDKLVTLDLPKKYKEWAAQQGIGIHSLQVRLTKIELESGETEILLTSLTDMGQISIDNLKELYALRWGVETAFSALKHKAELENFSGKSIRVVEQDYYAKLFMLNYAAILIQPVDRLLEEKPKKKYVHQVNRNEALARLKYAIIDLFLKGNIQNCLKMLIKAFEAFTEPIRKGRKFLRPQIPKRKYYRNYCHV